MLEGYWYVGKHPEEFLLRRWFEVVCEKVKLPKRRSLRIVARGEMARESGLELK